MYYVYNTIIYESMKESIEYYCSCKSLVEIDSPSWREQKENQSVGESFGC